MGTKAVLINTPKNTVQSDAHDWASIFNSIIGDVSGVLDYGKKLELKKINDNTVQLQDGVYSMQGHIIKVDKNTTQNLTITSGTLGMNRLDAVVVEYEKAADPKENDTFEFKVIRGTPVNEGSTSPVLPQLVKQDLLSGGSKRQEILHTVEIQGVSINKINQISKPITNLNEVTSHLIDIVDYIVEEGKDGNTIWEKYKNGNVMLITDKLISIPGNTSTSVKFTLPFDIVSSAEETYVNSILRTASGNVNVLRITRAWLSGVREISITVENTTGVQNGVFQTMLKGKYK